MLIKSDYLKNIPLFSNLSRRQIELIRSCCSNMTTSANSVILHQEDQSFDMYIILSGTVKVSLINEDSREVVLDILKEGDFFGELSLFDKKPRSATVTAISDAKIIVLQRDAFMKIIKEDAYITINILSVLARRLRRADESIETLAFLDVSGRVAKMLIELAKNNGKRLSDDSIKIQSPTHHVIADQIGASREAVTKAIKSLVSHGLITVNGREITIKPKHFTL